MPIYRLHDKYIGFPKPELAEEDGLLAVGGDLRPQRLLLAYSKGIFPWYNPGEEILWWCPKERFIIRPAKIHISKSMKKFYKKHDISIQINRDFADTMHHCRTVHEAEIQQASWITNEMEEAYLKLHKMGYAISVESFIDGELAGGLYGVVLGKCFFGESMFTLLENGSKLALISLAKILEENDFVMIDCQLHTDHLESLGGKYVTWKEYKHFLQYCR